MENLITVEHRIANDADWQALFVNGIAVGDEYQVGSQFQAVCDAMDILSSKTDLKWTALTTYKDWDDLRCVWLED